MSRVLPSGLIEGSPEANAAERAWSEAFEAANGPTDPALLRPRGNVQARLRSLGIDLRGTR